MYAPLDGWGYQLLVHLGESNVDQYQLGTWCQAINVRHLTTAKSPEKVRFESHVQS